MTDATVTIHDADRNIDLTFAVVFEYRPGTKHRMGFRDGGEQGEGPSVEVLKAVLSEGVIWFGDVGVDFTDLSVPCDATKILRQTLRDKYEADIEAKILEQLQVTA